MGQNLATRVTPKDRQLGQTHSGTYGPVVATHGTVGETDGPLNRLKRLELGSSPLWL